MPLVFLAEIFFLVFNYHAHAPIFVFSFLRLLPGIVFKRRLGTLTGAFQGMLVSIGCLGFQRCLGNVEGLYLVLCLRDSFHIFTLKVMFIVPITFITEMTFIGKITKTAFNFQYFQCSASFPL